MPRAKSDTIEAMGLEAFLNTRYGPYAYKRYVSMVTSGQPDSEIARAFGANNKPKHYQTVAGWRRRYLEERAKLVIKIGISSEKKN